MPAFLATVLEDWHYLTSIIKSDFVITRGSMHQTLSRLYLSCVAPLRSSYLCVNSGCLLVHPLVLLLGVNPTLARQLFNVLNDLIPVHPKALRDVFDRARAPAKKVQHILSTCGEIGLFVGLAKIGYDFRPVANH